MSTQTSNPPREPLWPNGVPNNPSKIHPERPCITRYAPPADKNSGVAVIICPGGSYAALAGDHEGKNIALWLNSLGITGIVLEYRMKEDHCAHPAPLHDAQRALRTVRFHAKEWNLNPNQIGLMGFSAGGHLASTTATQFDSGNPTATDPIDRRGSRPDFLILCYPVISFSAPFAHEGSRWNLLGDTPSKELCVELSGEQQVTADTPPTFLFHTDEDSGVVAEHSVEFYLALRKANVPAELHIYRQGAHGVGLAHETIGTQEWPNACANWMRAEEII